MGMFDGKVVIVTGGGKATLKDGSAGSIGYGIDIAFAKEGANLVITGRNVSKLEAAKESLEAEYGIKAEAVAFKLHAVMRIFRKGSRATPGTPSLRDYPKKQLGTALAYHLRSKFS